MNELALAVGSLVLGVIASVLVSRYYFRRSFTKSLTTFIQFSSSPLRGIDPAVKSALQIRYHDRPVENLYEIQFLVSNSGEKSIGEVIEPLSIGIPDGALLVDASIMHASPEGRRVELHIPTDRRSVGFRFPVLNAGDFFITKLLLDGSPREKDFIFSIVAAELPPTLKPTLIPPDAIVSTGTSKFEGAPLVAGCVFLLFGVAIAVLVWARWSAMPAWSSVTAREFFGSLGMSGWAAILSALPAFAFIVGGTMVAVSSFSGGRFPPRSRRFVVPRKHELLRTNWRIGDPGIPHSLDEAE